MQFRLVTVQGQHCHSASQQTAGLTDTQQVKQSVSQYLNNVPLRKDIVIVLYLWIHGAITAIKRVAVWFLYYYYAIGFQPLDYNTFSTRFFFFFWSRGRLNSVIDRQAYERAAWPVQCFPPPRASRVFESIHKTKWPAPQLTCILVYCIRVCVCALLLSAPHFVIKNFCVSFINDPFLIHFFLKALCQVVTWIHCIKPQQSTHKLWHNCIFSYQSRCDAVQTLLFILLFIVYLDGSFFLFRWRISCWWTFVFCLLFFP